MFCPYCCQRLVFCFEVFWVVVPMSLQKDFAAAWSHERYDACYDSDAGKVFWHQRTYLQGLVASLQPKLLLHGFSVFVWSLIDAACWNQRPTIQSQSRELLHVRFQILHHNFLYILTRMGCSPPTLTDVRSKCTHHWSVFQRGRRFPPSALRPWVRL